MAVCIVALILGFTATIYGKQAEAADVWVDRWNAEGIDVYVYVCNFLFMVYIT